MKTDPVGRTEAAAACFFFRRVRKGCRVKQPPDRLAGVLMLDDEL